MIKGIAFRARLDTNQEPLVQSCLDTVARVATGGDGGNGGGGGGDGDT